MSAPYYEADGGCACGCGAAVRVGRRYVSGHNRRGQTTGEVHLQRMREGMRRAWSTKRERMPIGATRIDHNGYRRVKVVAGAGRWVPEHILVMEQMVGRKLNGREVVHHVNGDRADNRPENLFLCRDRAHHNEVHRSQDVALRALLSRGLVTFRGGVYEAVL